jgi:hypothetical protein
MAECKSSIEVIRLCLEACSALHCQIKFNLVTSDEIIRAKHEVENILCIDSDVELIDLVNQLHEKAMARQAKQQEKSNEVTILEGYERAFERVEGQ